jgi:23S rRNA (guanosine2251-2'-O)-methyltransferase
VTDHVLGAISVAAVLDGGVRDVVGLLVSRPERHRALVAGARGRGIPVEVVDPPVLDALGSGHGGIAATVGPRRFHTLVDLPMGSPPFVAHLDGVEDPFNFGQAVRSLHAAGCDGAILAPRNWTTATATVTRSSAGATELLPMAVAEAEDAVAMAHDRGLAIVAGAAVPGAVDLWDLDLSGPLLVLVGGERRGITRSLLREVTPVRIPYGRPWDRSLGTVAATTTIAFEVARQRRD